MKKLIVSIISFINARTKVVMILVVLVGLLGLSQLAMAEAPISFADANLKAAVESRLNISNPTPTDMLDLEYFDARNSEIVNLTGIEYATNLIQLILFGNQISDISPLSGLTNLPQLILFDNQISNISPLSGLTGLTILRLDGNQISDISPLSGLTNLTELWLSNNRISDTSPLSGLANLPYLYLDGNQISDISPLSGLSNLTELWLSNNRISEISPLSQMTSLTNLRLDGNTLNEDAYCIYLPLIEDNNPDISLDYDPNPTTCPSTSNCPITQYECGSRCCTIEPHEECCGNRCCDFNTQVCCGNACCPKCPVSSIYGEDSEEMECLRNYRDNILSKSQEGRELIKLYYQWSPVIVKAMEQDEEFRDDVKEMIDGVLMLLVEEK